MTQAKMSFEIGPTIVNQKLILDGHDISHLVQTLTIAGSVAEMTSVQLGLFINGPITIPEALMDVVLIDHYDAIRLRNMLADAIIALETIMEAHDDAPTPQLREQIDHWKRHQEFPDGEKLGRYIERMREYDALRKR